MAEKREYSIAVKKDGKFYVGYCLEIPQARGQGDTKAEASCCKIISDCGMTRTEFLELL